jgi:L-fuconolactonase
MAGGALAPIQTSTGSAGRSARLAWDPLARVFDAWGFDRCLWGTDWTRAFAVVNYEQAVEPFRQTDRLSDSERAMLMGGACAKAYGWSPKNG